MSLWGTPKPETLNPKGPKGPKPYKPLGFRYSVSCQHIAEAAWEAHLANPPKAPCTYRVYLGIQKPGSTL